MSKANPLGLIANYGDSDEESDDGTAVSSKQTLNSKSATSHAAYETNQQTFKAPAGIHPAPIAHCPWSACYDENSGFTYYWNQQTNAVTWEAPPEYLLALKLAQQQLSTSGSTEVSAEEWQLYQLALAEKQSSAGKITSKSTTSKPTPKKLDKTTPRDKNIKNNKKRPVSDDEEEKIELITSYHNSDSESNDESEKPTPVKVTPVKPPAPKPPTKLPKNPQKKQKTKPLEYGPTLPPNQNYTVPIGPELPPEMLVDNKPKSPESKVENSTNDEDAKPTANDEDSQDEQSLLKRLKDKAKLLEKLGGELPSELQKIIDDEIRSTNASPKPESKDKDLDIDDLLEEIEKKELPKIVKSKNKMDESKPNSGNNSPLSGDRTPPLEELKTLYPVSDNGPVPSLFPSSANIEEAKVSPKQEPVVMEKEKKENVYLMDTNEPIGNTNRKKLRISNSVLPVKKSIEPPAYTTKYSQFIEGFSTERTGLGFSKDADNESSPKNTVNYGNGLTFTKGETLNEDKKDEDLDDLTDLLEAKLKYLNQLQPSALTPVQEMLIQMQTLVSAFRAGALALVYWRRWALSAEGALAAHEAAAAPPGWLCAFQRSEGRYCYRREADGFVQWEYPVADTDMEICTTPPHPASESKEEVVSSIAPPLPREPPPPSPPGWRDPPPPGVDHDPPPPAPEPKKEIGDELMSFYNDIAELEKCPTTAPASPEAPPPPEIGDQRDRDPGHARKKSKSKYSSECNSPEPPPPPEISEKKERESKPAKKKSKMKISSSLGMKQKSVSSLVAKWQQVADEINSD